MDNSLVISEFYAILFKLRQKGYNFVAFDILSSLFPTAKNIIRKELFRYTHGIRLSSYPQPKKYSQLDYMLIAPVRVAIKLTNNRTWGRNLNAGNQEE